MQKVLLNKATLCMIAASAVLCYLCYCLYDNTNDYFKEVQDKIRKKEVVCLSKETDEETLSKILNKYYFKAKEDANFVTKQLLKCMDKEEFSLHDLDDLKHKKFKIDIKDIEESNSPLYKEKLYRILAGNEIPSASEITKYDAAFKHKYNEQKDKDAIGKIYVSVKEREDTTFWDKIRDTEFVINYLGLGNPAPSSGVTVRLMENYYDNPQLIPRAYSHITKKC